MSKKHIYTIVRTSADADRGSFPTPDTEGSYFSLEQAQRELERLIVEEKDFLDGRFAVEDRSENHWEAYQDGSAALCFSRIEVLVSELHQ